MTGDKLVPIGCRSGVDDVLVAGCCSSRPATVSNRSPVRPTARALRFQDVVGAGSGRCGAGPTVIGGQSFEDALGDRAELSCLGLGQSVEDVLAHRIDVGGRDFLQVLTSRGGQSSHRVATIVRIGPP